MKYRAVIAVTVGVLFSGIHGHGLAYANERPTLESAALFFEEGNVHLENGNPDAALTSYHAAEGTGYVSGPLFYNIGNAYLARGDIAEAVLYYARARIFLRNSERVAHNMNIALSRIPNHIAAGGADDFVSLLLRLARRTGLVGLLILGFVLYLVSALIIGFAIWNGRLNIPGRRVLYVTIPASLVFLGTAVLLSLHDVDRSEAVVMEDRVSLQISPDGASEGERILYGGQLVSVLEDSGTWFEVRLPNGVTGWLPSQTVTPVLPTSLSLE